MASKTFRRLTTEETSERYAQPLAACALFYLLGFVVNTASPDFVDVVLAVVFLAFLIAVAFFLLRGQEDWRNPL